MSNRAKIYPASKLRWASMWRSYALTNPDIHFVARWPYLVGCIPDDMAFARNFWQDDLDDVKRSDVVLVFAEKEDILRGALIEVGAALAWEKRVYLVGENDSFGTWQHHPLITKFAQLDFAIRACQTGYWKNALD